MTSIPRFGAVYISQSEFHKLDSLGFDKISLGYPTKDRPALREAAQSARNEIGTHVGATTRNAGIILVTLSDGPAGIEPKGDVYEPGGIPQRRVTEYLNKQGVYYRVGNFKDLFIKTN